MSQRTPISSFVIDLLHFLLLFNLFHFFNGPLFYLYSGQYIKLSDLFLSCSCRIFVEHTDLLTKPPEESLAHALRRLEEEHEEDTGPGEVVKAQQEQMR